MNDLSPTAFIPTIHDLLLERKLLRVLEAHLYATTRQRSDELLKQFNRLLETRSAEFQAWFGQRQNHK